MATADVLQPSTTPAAPSAQPISANKPTLEKHNVETTLYYYKDSGDNSEPAPMYVGYA
jgi:hypothetical protein